MKNDPRPVTFVPSVDTGEAAARNRACLRFAGDLFTGKDVLDVGCWTGGFLSLIEGSAGRASAIDVDPAALAVARRNLPGARFVESSVLEMPFEDESFDVVTMWAVLEHLPAGCEPAALGEIRRVLRPGGHIALNVPNANLVARSLDPIFWLKGHRHYSLAQVEKMLETSGFTLERSTVQSGMISLAAFIFFCFWKYLVRRPEPSWPRYRQACERDANRTGFVELFALARKR